MFIRLSVSDLSLNPISLESGLDINLHSNAAGEVSIVRLFFCPCAAVEVPFLSDKTTDFRCRRIILLNMEYVHQIECF